MEPSYDDVLRSVRIELPDCRHRVCLDESIVANKSWSRSNNSFQFLNQNHEFGKAIDWEFEEFGKLWTYNLNYHDFLLQQEIPLGEGLPLIELYISHLASSTSLSSLNGLEPYPISLRLINWVKFFALNKIQVGERVNASLYAQALILTKKLEKHLLGNHYLENGFGLLFAAYYFQCKKLYKIAEKIVTSELEEQILSDGAHFELSPMYHQIILYRVLDCYNLVKNSPWMNQEMLLFLQKKAELMLQWLKQVTFSNGDIPLVNDSAVGIAPTTEQLLDYASRLGVMTIANQSLINRSTIVKPLLKESGYRMIREGSYELFCDVGHIGPNYIPGHAHADTLNFVLYVDGKPVIVDPGISTYEKNERRQYERGTAFHNTVTIEDRNSSDVWGGFRVAERARVVELDEQPEFLSATHDGYKKLGVTHKRSCVYNDNKIVVKDELVGKSIEGTFRLHFKLPVELVDECIIFESGKILFENYSSIKIENYKCAEGYNNFTNQQVVIVHFENEMTTVFDINI